ncbi:MAG: hypothetical protein JNL21_06095 [Myxococcales bacterium]|jgi:hypothetical protein|nr:hypothetical protein [Myxococcales bacterium]
MPTPNLKILLNALRLGQPQDPKAVAFVLAEAITAQDEAIEELRRKLAMMQQLTQVLEAKASRLEAELEAVRGGYPHGTFQAPPSARPHHEHAPPSHRPASQPPPVHRSAPPPPPAAALADGPSALRMPAPPEIPDAPGFEESVDDFRTQTVVVRQRDVLAARIPGAPFQITPAGAPPQPQGSIPGAPWAHNRGHHVQMPMDDYTVDAVALERSASSDDLEGETYHNQEGDSALRNLGIAGAQPSAQRPRTTPRIPDDETPDGTLPPKAKR